MVLFYLVAILCAMTSAKFGKRECLYILHHKNNVLNDHPKLPF